MDDRSAATASRRRVRRIQCPAWQARVAQQWENQRGMTISFHPDEPTAGPWRVERIADLFERFNVRARRGCPLVIAIDGRSSSGKTTLAARFAGGVPGTAIVHTDDIAWWHSRFGWTDLAQYVLETVRTGEALSFRPPAWIERGREGAIVVPSSIQVLLLEGVGSSREELAHLLDARLWVQAGLAGDRAAQCCPRRGRRDD